MLMKRLWGAVLEMFMYLCLTSEIAAAEITCVVKKSAILHHSFTRLYS